jgi:hypothetical protein
MVCGSDMSIDCIKELFIQGQYINQTTPNFSGLGLLGDQNLGKVTLDDLGVRDDGSSKLCLIYDYNIPTGADQA